MLSVEMLPAGHGDCLWLEYGQQGGELRRVLVDGGTSGTYKVLRQRLLSLPAAARRFELLVITHIDADHIGGIMKLLEDTSLGLTVGEVWFNGYTHLQAASGRGGTRGALQGEAVSALLNQWGTPWNAAFNGSFIAVPDDGMLPERTLEGDLRLTLLSPTPRELIELQPRWEQEIRRAGLVPGFGTLEPDGGTRGIAPAREALDRGSIDPKALAAALSRPDAGEPNGSSIALLAEYGGRSVLLTGDAFAATLVDSLRRLGVQRRSPRLKVDAFKLPHHASEGNVSRELLTLVRCPRYLVSTNGAYFGHPDPEAIARVLVDGGAQKTLLFNYRSAFTDVWGSQPALQAKYGYRTRYPARGAAGMYVAF